MALQKGNAMWDVKGKQKDMDTEGPTKLLDPYILAKRLRQLCAENKIDDAVTMLKAAPRDAMNTPVWNTMIWEALKVQRYQLAQSLYVDVSLVFFPYIGESAELFFFSDEKTRVQPDHKNLPDTVQWSVTY